MESVGKGKPAVYKRPIRAAMERANGAQCAMPIAWAEVNPEATKRGTVITGMRAAIGRNKNVKNLMSVLPNENPDLITVIVRSAPATA
jgi:hypothetical protein